MCKNEEFAQDLAGKQLAHWAGWREEPKVKRDGEGEVGEEKEMEVEG